MLGQGLAALLSHWKRHPVQLAMLLLGLALATALWSAVQAINREASASYDRAATVVGQDRLASLARADGARFPESRFADLRRAGWLVSPVIEGERRFGEERLRILGIDPLTLPPEGDQLGLSSETSDLLSFITPPGLLYVAPETAERLKDQSLPRLVIVNTLPPGTALTDVGIAQGLLGAQGEVSRLLLSPIQPQGLKPLADIAPDLVRRAPGTANDLSRLTDSFHLNLTAFGFLSFVVGLFIVHGAIGLAFEQRRPVFRTLRALGLPLRSLMLLLAAELFVLAFVAAMTGIVLGYLIAVLLLPDVAASLRGLYGADVPGTLTIRPAVWGAGLVIAMAGTFASSATRFWALRTMPLFAPAQPGAWVRHAERMARLQGAGAVLLLLLSAALILWGRGLTMGFAALGTLLIGAALLLPVLIALCLRAGAALSSSAVARWFWADTRMQLPGLSLALMALLLALATNIGVGTMVASFRQTFVGYLDQRLASELYVSARTPAESKQLQPWLEARADAVLPVWNAEAIVDGQPSQIFGFRDHATYRDHWPLLQEVPDVWDRVAAEKGVLINEQLHYRAGLNLGDIVHLPGNIALPVAGIFSDYGNPKGQIMMALHLLDRTYPDANRLRFGIRIARDKAPALAEELQTSFGLPSENIINQAELKAFSLKIFERTFTVTAALNVLTLGVAAIAILSSLLTLASMRLPQLAPVWAMGLTRGGLAKLELLRSVALAGLTALLAVPVGLALAWLLLAVVNVEAFGWRLPLRIFPVDIMRLGVLALVAAAAASLLPALRLVRRPPAELLRVFAHER